MKKRRTGASKAGPAPRRLDEARLTAGSPRAGEDAVGTPALPGGAFSELDRHFARFIERRAGGNRPEVALAAALVSYYRSQGHICLDLAAVAGQWWPGRPEVERRAARCPELDAWIRALRTAPVVGVPGEFKPLVLDGRGRLYLHRYWEYETALAQEIQRRAADAVGEAEPERPEDSGSDFGLLLDRLFPTKSEPAGEPDGQRLAALTAMQKQFCVISGGPGTGKTRTLVRILALLLEAAQAGGRRLRFAVAAPTGKAAARIQDELRKAKEQLPCAEEIKAQLPDAAMTLHRLLGAVPGSAFFQHDAKNPLPADVVVVDEASMVDLALAAKLFAAVRPTAKVILLGDKDQLASVEAGAVLGDICAGAPPPAPVPESDPQNPLSACIVQLRTNYRFGERSAIHQLSTAIKAGDADGARAILDAGRRADSEARWAPLPTAAELKAALKEKLFAGYGPYFQAAEPRAALAALGRFRILCAVRDGPYGVTRLNELAAEILDEAGLAARSSRWYSHRPVMATRNDYHLRLFNGDLGVILPDPRSGQPRAFFLGAESEPRPVLPARLPPHETVFAMTVHKSQGSEFEHLLLVLPERDSPLLTRELLYTGLTRARSTVELWCSEAVFGAAVARRGERNSGLREALWGGPDVFPP